VLVQINLDDEASKTASRRRICRSSSPRCVRTVAAVRADDDPRARDGGDARHFQALRALRDGQAEAALRELSMGMTGTTRRRSRGRRSSASAPRSSDRERT
jgi:hypothetical protein